MVCAAPVDAPVGKVGDGVLFCLGPLEHIQPSCAGGVNGSDEDRVDLVSPQNDAVAN